MIAPTSNTAVYLIPGMSIKIEAMKAYISPASTGKFPGNGGEFVDLPLIRGFAVLYPDVGTIAVSDDVAPSIKYTHKKFSPNKIYFMSRTGEMGIVDVISVPIHDHSSIVTGGPAYGTYFTDDETLGA